MSGFDEQLQSDESLIEGLRAGEVECGRRLIERHWEAIQRFCGSYLGDQQLAEDVTQETFAKLSDGTELPSGAVKPWLYKIARNRCLDILRRHQRSPTHHQRIRTGFDAATSTAGPSTRLAREERQRLIREIIENMPEEYRSVLMLKHFEDFSRAEMAETLGLTDAAVKGRLVRAAEYLREQLGKYTRLNP